MSNHLPNLGELEIQVLRTVWEHQPCTERQVSDLVQEQRDVARTTVLKTMQRLEGKSLLRRVANSSPVQFRAVKTRNRVMPELVRRFVDGILGGSADPLVAYLADSKKLSSTDISALQEIAKKITDEETS